MLRSGGNHREVAATFLQEDRLFSGSCKEASLGMLPGLMSVGTKHHPDGNRVHACVCRGACSQKTNAESSQDPEVWRWAKAYF